VWRARPNIVFMDIVMPQMDGFEACRRLAADPRTKSIPVVFVSTKSQRADQIWARMQGGRDLIGKPYTSSQVLDALRHAV
jgi:twitching motility two-component system response regulator PilH